MSTDFVNAAVCAAVALLFMLVNSQLKASPIKFITYWVMIAGLAGVIYFTAIGVFG